MRHHAIMPLAMPLRALRVVLLGGLSTGLLWAACGPSGTPCKTDAECLNGFYCAQTDKHHKFCVRRPTQEDGGQTTDKSTPPPDQRINPPSDRQVTPPGDRRTTPLPERRTPPGDHHTTPPPDDLTPPDTNLPKGCIPPPYDPSKDRGNGGKTVPLDNLDKAFFKKLRTIYYASKVCKEKIWGGKYQMHLIPTYLVNIGNKQAGTGSGHRGFLLNHPKPPSGATLIDSRLVYGIANVYLYNDLTKKVPQPGFAFGMQVGGVACYAFEFGSSDDFIDPTKGREVFAFFVHEGFHRVQEYEESWKQASGSQDTSRYPLDAESLAMALLEGRILLGGYKGADAQTALLQFFATQKARFEMDKSGVLRSHDALQEWLEGTAQYTEIHYLIAIGDPYPETDVNSLTGRLSIMEQITADPSYTPTKEDLLNFFTARFYATGAVIGILLDRLGDKGWKDKIRQGQTFHEILSQRFGNANLSQALQQAKTRYKYNEVLTLGRTYAKIR